MAYVAVEAAMNQVATTFPFDDAQNASRLKDPIAIGETVEALKAAKAAEEQAMAALHEAVRADWGEW